ncbi:beta family protein [Burkholderia ambifaria]|uniref:beta family protein n=1 Tax=Burkholderia ambifaria TaxID=152480 RepID=UPI00158DE031|nr:beta family protein [Burkholderia ambifaria]
MADFENHSYFPALMSRVAEIQGLRELDEGRKEQIIPLFTLGRWHNSLDFDRAIQNCSSAIGDGRPYFADLTREARHAPDVFGQLLSPDNNFSAWRSYVGQFDEAIPVVQIMPDVTRRQIYRQAQLIEQSREKLAFRVRNPEHELPLVINALCALDEPDNAMVFIDLKYVRGIEREAAAVATDAIDRIRDEVVDARIVVLSSSFPSYVGQFVEDEGETRGSIEILERQLHAELIGDGRECIYGDYASIHPIIRGGGGTFIPRIDAAHTFTWNFERRPELSEQRREGYQACATALLNRYPDLIGNDCWGAEMIRQAAEGNPHGLAPASWIAARVNMHLSRQIDYVAEADDGEDWEDLL